MPPSATPCHRALAAPVGCAANERNCDGSTPTTAVSDPLIRILTASIRSAATMPGSRGDRGEQRMRQRERRDDEQVRLDGAAQRRDHRVTRGRLRLRRSTAGTDEPGEQPGTGPERQRHPGDDGRVPG